MAPKTPRKEARPGRPSRPTPDKVADRRLEGEATTTTRAQPVAADAMTPAERADRGLAIRDEPVAVDQRSEAERMAESAGDAPHGTTTTRAHPGAQHDRNAFTEVHDGPGTGNEGASTAARDQELAIDGTREAEARFGAGASREDLPKADRPE